MKTLDNILEEIANLTIECAGKGIHPHEVWIGPEEAECFLSSGYSNLKFLTGLTIRLSKLNGIRVGTTFSND